MISVAEMERMLSGLLDELPQPLFDGLNGGVQLLEEEKPDPDLPGIYILGECVQDFLGNSILLYYGSFARLFAGESRLVIRQELRKTLRHEFRHHVEAMAGADDLDQEDARQIEAYRREEQARQNPQQAAAAAKKQGRRDGWRLLQRLKKRG